MLNVYQRTITAEEVLNDQVNKTTNFGDVSHPFFLAIIFLAYWAHKLSDYGSRDGINTWAQ